MDLADLKRKADAAREYQVQVGALAFTCRLPTTHEVEMETARAWSVERDNLAVLLRVRRALVERCVVSWVGVTEAMLGPGATDVPAEVSPAAVGLLMDADEAVADELQAEFVKRSTARNEQKAAAAKN
jgi:hypothetical protein